MDSVYEMISGFTASEEGRDIDTRSKTFMNGLASQIDQLVGKQPLGDLIRMSTIVVALGGAVSGAMERRDEQVDG